MVSLLRTVLADESGATAIEYGLIGALVSVAAIASLDAFGGELITLFETISSNLIVANGNS